MPNAYFEQIIIDTITARAKILGYLWLIILVLLIINIIVLHTTKANRGFSVWNFLLPNANLAGKMTLKEQIAYKLIAVILIPLLLLIWFILPAISDISKKQYIEIDGLYVRTELSSDTNLFSNGHVNVETSEGTLTLMLPARWTAEEFPLGTFNGTICYAKDTHIILSLSTDAKDPGGAGSLP